MRQRCQWVLIGALIAAAAGFAADGPPPAAQGDAARAMSATAAITAVARSRAAGTKTAGASAEVATSEDAYLGSVETSLSHLVSRRVRSADDPYLAKS